jgi:alpha-1,2-mannosyltransferase
VVVAGVALVALLALFVRTLDAPRNDFAVYYAAARSIRDGASVYAPALAWVDAGYTVHAPAPDPLGGVSPYVYPPIFAVELIPLTFLPLPVATVIWSAFTMACLLAAAYLLVGLLFPGASGWAKLVAVLMLGAIITFFQPARSTLYFGQADALLLLLMTLGLAAFARGRDRSAALWLAAAIAIKPAAGFLLLFFLWKRAYRAAALAAAVGGLLVLAPFAFLGPQAAVDAFRVVTYWSSASFAVSVINQAPYGLLLRLFTSNPFTVPMLDAPFLATVLRVGVVLATLLLLALTIRRSRAVAPAQLAFEYGLVIIGMLLAGPLSENFHYVYLALPLVVTGAVLFTGAPGWARLACAAALLLVLGYLSLPGLTTISHGFYEHYTSPLVWPRSLFTGAHLYGLVALTLLMVVVWRTFLPHRRAE